MYLEIFSSRGSKVGFPATVAAARRVNRVNQPYHLRDTLRKFEHQILQPLAPNYVPEQILILRVTSEVSTYQVAVGRNDFGHTGYEFLIQIPPLA